MTSPSSFNPGGNATGYNITGNNTTGFSSSGSSVPSNDQWSSIFSNPQINNGGQFSAFGSGQVNIPGITPATGGQGSNVPAYVANIDPHLIGQLTSVYGEGAGDSLYNFLSTGAGYNPQVAQQLLQQFQPQIAQGSANLAAQFGAAGAGNSSAAAIAQGSFQAQMANDENTMLANLYEQGSNNYMNMLEGVSGVGGGGTNIGNNKHNLSDTLTSILGGVSAGAGALSIAGVGGGSGTMATILAVLGAL